MNQEFDKLFWRRGSSFYWRIERRLKMLKLNLQHTKKLLGDVTEFLIESTKFDLPTNFLKNGYKL
jgi:trigger factor